MYLDQITPYTPCATQAFFNTTPERMRQSITDDNELEDKTTLALFINGEPASDYRFIEHYNRNHPNAPITYVGALMEQALKDEGIIFYGDGQTKAHTKNLVSYCFDTTDGGLSEHGITLRIRHEEYRDSGGHLKMRDPDISTKFQLTPNDTSSRAEFEATEDFARGENGQPKFMLSLLPIINDQMQKRFNPVRPETAQVALNWLRKFTDLVGFDFADKREKSNINCRRTQPYAVMYTRFDHEGHLVVDDKTRKPKLFKDDAISKREQIQGIRLASKIVFMLCLDVNRIFDPEHEGQKIMRDNEWEHEHQDHACPFTPGSIKSSDNVTRAEIDAMDDHLKTLKAETMASHGIKKSPLSGLNKDARAHIYVQRKKGQDAPMRPELTLRGRTDNLVLDRVNGFENLMKRLPIVKQAYDVALTQQQPSRKLG
jgi:hypothetical protein